VSVGQYPIREEASSGKKGSGHRRGRSFNRGRRGHAKEASS
jgi:hypothetical protein